MKLVLQFASKGSEPKIVCCSKDNDKVYEAFNGCKEDGYVTEIVNLGQKLKSYYGQPKPQKVAKKVAPKTDKED